MKSSPKHIFKITVKTVIAILVMKIAYDACKIETLTHLSDDDLDWVESFTSTHTHNYKNQYGDTDTLLIEDYILYNSTFPFMNPSLKFEISPDYLARAFLMFKIKHKGFEYKGNFFMQKDTIDLILDYSLDNLSLTDTVYENCQTHKINKLIIDEENNQKPRKYQDYRESAYKITSCFWIKGSGLTSYEFENGERYELCK